MRLLIAISLLLVPALVQAESVGDRQGASAVSIKGDVLYWEGEELVVKEISGREARVRVNEQTKIEGASSRLKTGDKIEAMVTSEGIAQSIRLYIPEGGAGLPPPLR